MLTRWDLLKPGDSVIVETGARSGNGQRWARENGRKFVTKKKPYLGWLVLRIE